MTNEGYKTTGKRATTQKFLEARSQGCDGINMETSHQNYGQKKLKHYILENHLQYKSKSQHDTKGHP